MSVLKIFLVGKITFIARLLFWSAARYKETDSKLTRARTYCLRARTSVTRKKSGILAQFPARGFQNWLIQFGKRSRSGRTRFFDFNGRTRVMNESCAVSAATVTTEVFSERMADTKLRARQESTDSLDSSSQTVDEYSSEDESKDDLSIEDFQIIKTVGE